MAAGPPWPLLNRGHSTKTSFTRTTQYARMSTDHRRYSIENRKQVIAEYALLHDLEIVRIYADEGRSSVHIKRREALKRRLIFQFHE
jgi:DNA invertase Pin-like site-specific DNA recombinase